AGETKAVGDLTLLQKGATITGAVTDENGHTVAGIPVRAWRLDGSEFQETVSNSSGDYTLHVISGTWELRAAPPLTSTYVTAQSPQRVVLPNDVAHKIQPLRVATADVTITGQVVNSADSTPITGIHGRVFALYDADHGRWTQLGPAAPIVNGQFTLKLSSHVANNYAIRAFFPQSQGYTALKSPPIHVSAGQTIANYTLPAAPNNSSISGHFNNHDTGEPQLDLPGIVYAASDNGGRARDRLNPVDGSYQMDVATTDLFGHGGSFWRVHGFVDPVSGYAVQRPRVQRVFIPFNDGDGADVTADFTVARIDAAIGGRVTDAQGNPVPGARVSLHERNAPAGEAFDRWDITGLDGRYRVRVTAGTYVVRADFRNLIQPAPQVVTVAAGAVGHADLQFRPKNAVIAGQVTYQGTAHIAFIRAYSDGGAHVVTLAGLGGHYALGVNAGDTWHVQAVSEEISTTGALTETVFLKSERLAVTPHPGLNSGADLALQVSDTLPDALAFAFDAGDDQVLTLSDGSQLIIPAGALATDGPVVVTARPLVELADDGGAQPVHFGYRVHAFDANHIPITHFNTPVTIALPFTAEQLATLGVTADQLIPSYWDEATASWKPVENVSVEVDPSGGGVVNIAVDHFTDYALLAASGPYQVFLPLIAH
ncbi:MAG TPA: carboxypeptidase-like regulatory domain-containing protein, partial [Roseiflexaceae bacterium]